VRFLADENVGLHTIEVLRRLGHDVASIREEAAGSTDEQVLARASADARVLLTFDKDFGELAFRWGLAATSGVILIRVRGSADAVSAAVVAALDAGDRWEGHFAVVESGRVRLTPMPRAR
jgi:predicted nuclease of predicted toxin-antitoxin system